MTQRETSQKNKPLNRKNHNRIIFLTMENYTNVLKSPRIKFTVKIANVKKKKSSFQKITQSQDLNYAVSIKKSKQLFACTFHVKYFMSNFTIFPQE